jgi:hypothetical protein
LIIFTASLKTGKSLLLGSIGINLFFIGRQKNVPLVEGYLLNQFCCPSDLMNLLLKGGTIDQVSCYWGKISTELPNIFDGIKGISQRYLPLFASPFRGIN